MKITINQRIAAGFGLLVILMLLMSASSLRGISLLDEQVTHSGEKIIPILVTSGDMGVSLLSANKALMQGLTSDQLSVLSTQTSKLKQLESRYVSTYEQLGGLTQTFESLKEHLTLTNKDAQLFFENTHKIQQQQKLLLETQPILIQARQNTQKLLDNFKTELEDIVAYGDDHQEMSAASTLLARLETLEEQLAQLRDIQSSEALAKTVSDIDSGLKAIVARNDKLKQSHQKTGDDLGSKIEGLNQSLYGTEGSITLSLQQSERKAHMDTLLVQVTKAINSATESLNALQSNIQQLTNEQQDYASSAADTAQNTNLLLSLISVLFAAGIGYSVYRSIKSPLIQMMKMLSTLASGDMTQRINIERQDEFGDLSKWINQLADQLADTIYEIRQGADQVSNSVNDTSALCQQTRQNMEEQHQQTAIVVSSIDEMLSCVQEIAQNAELAQDNVLQMDQSAQKNRSAMAQNIKKIQLLNTEITSAREVVNELHESSNTIGHILEVISGIAEQTNLLALNAAIEAARAGDQGRGFAVVADEVRSLAASTQDATSDIQNIIERLQQGASQAVTIMERSSNEVEASKTSIEQSGQDLEGMLQHLDGIRSMSEQVATAAEEQSYACQEVSTSVQKIASMSEKCSDDSGLIADECTQMTSLAETQQNLVDRFKLKEEMQEATFEETTEENS